MFFCFLYDSVQWFSCLIMFGIFNFDVVNRSVSLMWLIIIGLF
jgi:hypothetical protein